MEKTGTEGRQNCLLRPETSGFQHVRLIGSSQGRARSPLGRVVESQQKLENINVTDLPED